MTRLPRVTATQVLRALTRDGWYVVRRRGSHVILGHSSKPRLTVVPVHRGRTLKPGLLQDILDDAGLSPEELRRLL
ncbi:MAG: type II toxin-antitoxin system HicA family toxin [Chloroflexi bacterium]|nr:type II toxin-antitoxin system HicA family toxin [Chloroflexota bacterium]